MKVLTELSARFKRFVVYLRQTLEIPDVADQSAVIDFVRTDMDFRGAKAWILIAAVLLASLGLNVNSTAVIIGAMLISPLMGPIIGIGVSLGISDRLLFFRGLRNLATAVALSLIASALYFTISPFSEADSELLARTTPTLLDALIAITGGAAGAIAMVRLDRSNVVPGVAIATALMPPLCTAGYAISQWNMEFLLGAFYLFFINSVYIAASTFAVVRLLKFDHVEELAAHESRRYRRYMWAVVIVTMIPSIYTGWNMFRRQAFEHAVDDLRQQAESKFATTSFVVSKIHWSSDTSEVVLTLVGDLLSDAELKGVEMMADELGLTDAHLELRQSRFLTQRALKEVRESMRSEELLELYQSSIEELSRRDSLIGASIDREDAQKQQVINIEREIRILDPNVVSLAYAHNDAYATFKRRPSRSQIAKLQDWLRVRFGNQALVLKVVSE